MLPVARIIESQGHFYLATRAHKTESTPVRAEVVVNLFRVYAGPYIKVLIGGMKKVLESCL